MADDESPRLAPPPKPTLLKFAVARPEVPDVSLFDSDDSLIWNHPKICNKSSSVLHPQKLKQYKIDTSVKETPSVICTLDVAANKPYNPTVYSPSQNIARKGSSEPQSSRYRSLLSDNYQNILQPRESTTNKNEGEKTAGDGVNDSANVYVKDTNQLVPYSSKCQAVPYLKKAVHFDEHSPSPDTVVRPKTANTNSKYVGAPRNTSDIQSRNDMQTSNNFAHKQLIDSKIPSTSQTPPMRYGSTANTYKASVDDLNILRQSDTATVSQPPQYVNRNHDSIDPKIYQLIEDQNQHILRLYKTLESFMDKKYSLERDSSWNCDNRSAFIDSAQQNHCKAIGKHSQHIATQTSYPHQPETRSVGTNTDYSWSEILFLRKQSDVKYDDRMSPVLCRNRHKNREMAHRESPRVIPKHRNFSNLGYGGEVKEFSLSMREVVMTLQEDHSGNREEYEEVSEHEYRENQREYHGNARSSEVGDRASPSSLNHDGYLSPQYIEQERNHPPAPTVEAPTGTFYKNVLANIEVILQSSKKAEEDQVQNNQEVIRQEADVQDNIHEVVDPQMEALRTHCSFFDPASLTANRRPMFDSMYMPGLQNMLSVYQSTIVRPHNIYRETDAMAAKYLTDTQLAAIAAMSPAMKGASQHRPPVRGRASSAPFENQYRNGRNIFQEQNHATEEYSIATKQFLGKYGLMDNE